MFCCYWTLTFKCHQPYEDKTYKTKQNSWSSRVKIICSKPALYDWWMMMNHWFIRTRSLCKCGFCRETYRLFCLITLSVFLVWGLSVMCRGLCTVLTPFHSTLILTSSPPSGPLSYFTVSEVKLSRLRCFSRASGSLRTSATRCLWTVSRPWHTHTQTHTQGSNKCQFN